MTINGVRAELGQRVQGRDEIRIDGRVLRRARNPEKLSVDASTFLCNRSPGQSLTEELVPKLPRRAGKRFLAVSPMPNVDGGLELLTTDGALATRLQRRVRRWLTEFLIRVRGELTPESLDAIAGGQLDDGRKLSVLAVEGRMSSPRAPIVGIASRSRARAARRFGSCSSGKARSSAGFCARA